MYKLTNSKKSQKIIASLMVSILAFIVLLIVSTPLREEISKVTNGTFSSELNSSNTGISTANKATVIMWDMALFYFIGTLIAASIAFVTGRKSFVGTITAIFVFILVSVLITPLKDLIILARDSGHLGCANAAITVGNRLACIVVDLWLFYVVVTVIAAAATFIFVKKAIPK